MMWLHILWICIYSFLMEGDNKLIFRVNLDILWSFKKDGPYWRDMWHLTLILVKINYSIEIVLAKIIHTTKYSMLTHTSRLSIYIYIWDFQIPTNKHTRAQQIYICIFFFLVCLVRIQRSMFSIYLFAPFECALVCSACPNVIQEIFTWRTTFPLPDRLRDKLRNTLYNPCA